MWEFITAVWGTWVEKVGLILTILPFVEKIPRVKAWLNDEPLIDRFVPLIWMIGLGCIFWGCFAAWSEERGGRIAEHNARVQLETARPYVLIEELSPAQIRARIMAGSRNSVLPDGAYTPGYAVGKTPDGELLVYNVRNLPGTVPARGIRDYQKLTVISETGQERVVSIQPQQTNGEVLFPDRFATHEVQIPDGTMFVGSAPSLSSVRIKLVVTYLGQRSDPNTYFYEIVLKRKQLRDVEDLNKESIGSVIVEMTDEGVVKDLDQLIR